MARVLVVDDEENIRIAFQDFLEQGKHEVHLAEDVKKAERLLGENDFDVVVTDIIMPGSKGTDLLKTISKDAKGIQVIMITGEPTVDTASEAVRAGAFDYLSKPVNGKDLQKVVAKAAVVKALHDEKKRLTEENIHYQKNLEKLVGERTAKLKRLVAGIVKAMSIAVEKRDLYTAGHQMRVAVLAKMIAMEMKLPEDKAEGVYMAGVIHDIGKISVPAEILSKPGRLSEEEYGLVKKHPRTGYEILRKIEFPWPIADIVLQHHERFDGSGYPQGLSGDDILVEARILGVADTVEAMASHRAFRPALGFDKAMEEISKNKGKLYDPVVVDACLALFQEKDFRLQAPEL